MDVDEATAETEANPGTRRRSSRSPVRALAMRPRRTLVKVHRWTAIGLMAWLVVIATTGGWLVERRDRELVARRPLHVDAGRRRRAGATDAALGEAPDDANDLGVTLPTNGRGVYQVDVEIRSTGRRSGRRRGPSRSTRRVYVDPGSGAVNGARDDEEGFRWWLYRGHMYLWQDHGVLGVFDRRAGGAGRRRKAPSRAG